jgi:hypothetical protein
MTADPRPAAGAAAIYTDLRDLYIARGRLEILEAVARAALGQPRPQPNLLGGPQRRAAALEGPGASKDMGGGEIACQP